MILQGGQRYACALPTIFAQNEMVATLRFAPRASLLVARALGIVERSEGFLELRRDRDVEPLAGRQPRDEPFVVERDQVAARAELAEGALDHILHLRLALAVHYAVGIV